MTPAYQLSGQRPDVTERARRVTEGVCTSHRLHRCHGARVTTQQVDAFFLPRLRDGVIPSCPHTSCVTEHLVLLTSDWGTAAALWRDLTSKTGGLLQYRTHVYDDVAARPLPPSDRLVLVTWMTAHLPMATYAPDDDGPVGALAPRLELALGPHVLPDVSAYLWKTDMCNAAAVKREPDVELFSRTLPRRCSTRDYLKFVFGYARQGARRRLLIDRALLCTLLGLYPHTCTGPVPTFASMLRLYAWLYVPPVARQPPGRREGNAVAEQVMYILVVRELMVYLVRNLPAMERVMMDTGAWGSFVDGVRADLPGLRRRHVDADFVKTLPTLSKYVRERGVYFGRRGVSGWGMLSRALVAAVDAARVGTHVFDREVERVVAASDAGKVGLAARVDHGGAYDDAQRDALACLMRKLHHGVPAPELTRGAAALLARATPDANLAVRVLAEVILAVRLDAVQVVSLPEAIAAAQRSAVAREWTPHGGVQAAPHASTIWCCVGCGRVPSRHASAKNVTCAHGAVDAVFDTDTCTLWCAQGGATDRVGARASAQAALCRAVPLLNVPLEGAMLVYEGHFYSVCTRCARLMHVASLLQDAFVCTHCRRGRPGEPRAPKCVVCLKPTNVANLNLWHVHDDQAETLACPWEVCDRCARHVARAGALSDVSAGQLQQFRESVQRERQMRDGFALVARGRRRGGERPFKD